MKQYLISKLVGSVILNLEGNEIERFLNILTYHDIDIYHISYKRVDNIPHSFAIELPFTEYEKTKDLCKKYRVRILSTKITGVPSLYQSYGNRYGFFCGFLLCFAFLILMSNCVWKIECNGNSYHTNESLIKYLSNRNIHYGCFSFRLNLEKEALQLRKTYNDIAWCNLTLDGCNLILTITETQETGINRTKKNTGISYLAPHNGQITSIVTRKGTSLVKKGDKVKKNQILIAGYLCYKNDNDEITDYKPCNADGDIIGKYKKKIHLSTSFRCANDQSTFKKDNHILQYTNKLYHFLLPKAKDHFEQGILRDYNQLPIIYKIFPNINLISQTTFYYPKEDRTLTAKEAKAILENKLAVLYKKIREKDGKILEKKLHLEDNSREVIISGYLWIEEPFQVSRKTKLPKIRKEDYEP